ncbi:ABC transporter permease [Bowmanella yangjiangensis]|uniref:ABC transporter permease n=1 Tax=Bowmanella yangjiangensis TaxID=2811230 RepID=A0ABS3CQR8_9ALTE|nr:FtsX-like permease family protein [Bowmanella yangjiangensis]MBN7819426.1 ABC transporter permease [Bowmanella yangjiangensis]
MSELKPIFNALWRSKTGALLLIVQIAVTLAIVSNAAFIIHDRVSFLNQDTGLKAEDLFRFNLYTFGKNVDIAKQQEIDETLLRAIPGVADAVVINQVPLSGSGDSTNFHLKPTPQQSRGARAAFFMADENLLNTLDVKLEDGRNFEAADVVYSQGFDKTANVLLATRSYVNELFPDGDGLGQTIYLGDNPFKIIGIIAPMKGPWLDDEQADNVALIPQVMAAPFKRVLIRTEPGRRGEVMQQVEKVLLASESERVVSRITGVDKLLLEQTSQDRLMKNMLLVLITVLLLVTALGICGLALFNVGRRTRQIGTRRALGAKKSDIVRYFLLENTLVSLIGIVLGVGLALAMSDVLMRHYSLPRLDNWFILYSLAGIYVMGVLAVYWPAQRATLISPSIATRSV